MDKIKPYLAMVKKHHFWILSVLVVIIAMTVWSIAAAEMKNNFKTRRDKIKGLEEGAKKVAQLVDPPNDKVVEKLQDCNRRLEQKVYEAWFTRYFDQKKRNPWPAELGPEFLMMINSLPDDANAPLAYRETYQTFIKNYFPRLFEIIDLRRTVVRWRPSMIGMPGKADATVPPITTSAPPGAEIVAQILGGTPINIMTPPPELVKPGLPPPVGEQEFVGKVVWEEADIKRVVSRFLWHHAPATIEMRLAQEDLWVYKALLEIIRDTNGSVRFKDLPIRKIETLQIGQNAAQAFAGSKNRLGAASLGAPAGMPGMEGGMPGMEAGMGGMAAPMGGATPSGNEVAQRLNQFRYVDQQGNPLAADAKPPFAEFKMMPVYMKLIINQMKLPELLAKCANSAMPVEVSRIAFQPGQAAVVSLGGAPGMGPGMGGGGSMPGMEAGMGGMAPGMAPGMPPEMMGGMGGMGGMPGMGPGGGMPGMGPGGGMPGGGGGNIQFAFGAGTQTLSGEYVPIEVFGIIYLFVRPDPAKLGTGSVAEQARAPATAPAGAAPAATAPAGTVAPGTPVAPAAPGATTVPAPAVPAAAPSGAPGAAAPGAAQGPGPAAPAPAAGGAAPGSAVPAPGTPVTPAGVPPATGAAAMPGGGPAAPPAAAAPVTAPAAPATPQAATP